MAKAIKKKSEPVSTPVTTTEVETTKEIPGKTVFSFTAPTPHWMTWVFRTEFVLNKALSFWLAATTIVPKERLSEYILILLSVDLATWTLARSLGVKKEEIEN